MTAASASGHGNRMNVASRLVQWANGLGHGTIIFTCDQEPAIVELQGGAEKERIRAPEDIATHVKSARGMDADTGI